MSHVPDKSHVPEGINQGKPTWDVASLFPTHGSWSVRDYLVLDTNHLVEFSEGVVEFLPMPTMTHQLIVMFLCHCLDSYVTASNLGTVLVAPFKVRLWDAKYREPDVMFMNREHVSRMAELCWHGADLVMEVVSPDDPNRDLETKRLEYAQAGIPEYWIADPKTGRITVLWLDGASYSVHGEFSAGEQATSRLLPGFVVEVKAALVPKS